ncbi:hypothetical protein [Pediococcus ethanolidurans]|uniref:Uncharacterized protein n=1 Tax=Pediococcus ethanolidurans TaxID=319653 RepID=A0A0R2K9I7_9LACO|nr:hypothetical protein [Pediococcus ethanolidurans]KRN82909.1 hypothetical protein IV87_GL001863 [Pediococcus ethanolidurans]GEN94676.1 hypothetical protein PET01_07260 [Pediococcus ethanolidurans]SER17169.1 hypothetical protein SAMN04487973_102133 [Pediococcus ethanolidurans]
MNLILTSIVISAAVTGLMSLFTAWIERNGNLQNSRINTEPEFAKQVSELQEQNGKLIQENITLRGKIDSLQEQIDELNQTLKTLNGGK